MIGLGMAAAVVADALIVRTVLVPAVMHMLGNDELAHPGRPRPDTPAPRPGRRRRGSDRASVTAEAELSEVPAEA